MKFFLYYVLLDTMEHWTNRALLPQSPYKKRSLKPYHIKYYGLIAVFLMMITAVKVFINYATIQTSIAQVMKDTINIWRHRQYKLLQSYIYRLPESSQFIAHDNSILLPWERVFTRIVGTWSIAWSWSAANKDALISQAQAQLSPFMSWIQYFGKKMAR